MNLRVFVPPWQKRIFFIFIFLILLTTIFLVTNFSFSANSSNEKASIKLQQSNIQSPENSSYATSTDTFPLPDSLSTIDTLLIAHKSKYRMSLYAKGKLLNTYIIALGQEPIGHKQTQGDNRTPEGKYKIIQKTRGPFEGGYSHYLGVAWMRLNYPNNADAINGFKKGLISEVQKNLIVEENNSGKEPIKTTKLGGGIGIHGWYGEWPEKDQQNLTWGCISVQNTELNDLYKRVPIGTTIVILP